LEPGAVITTSRNDVDYVVTEYGAALLKAQSLRQRAKNLIAVAHPDHRDLLAETFEKRFGETL
jgi:4-hydroxybutyrate CoA-transferase